MAVNIYGSSSIGSVLLGVLTTVINEKYTNKSEVPSTTLENRSIISDHIINMPETLTIEFLISNIDADLGGAYGMTSALAHHKFIEAAGSNKLFSVGTKFTIYDDMAITDYTSSNTNKEAGVLFGTLSFKKMYTVSTFLKYPPADLAQDGTQATASSTQQIGTVVTQDVSSNSDLQSEVNSVFGS